MGPSFGRKMMTGYLASQGIMAAEVRVGRALRQAHPPYHRARQQVTIVVFFSFKILSIACMCVTSTLIIECFWNVSILVRVFYYYIHVQTRNPYFIAPKKNNKTWPKNNNCNNTCLCCPVIEIYHIVTYMYILLTFYNNFNSNITFISFCLIAVYKII